MQPESRMTVRWNLDAFVTMGNYSNKTWDYVNQTWDYWHISVIFFFRLQWFWIIMVTFLSLWDYKIFKFIITL